MRRKTRRGRKSSVEGGFLFVWCGIKIFDSDNEIVERLNSFSFMLLQNLRGTHSERHHCNSDQTYWGKFVDS